MSPYSLEKALSCRVWLIVGCLICLSSILVGAFAAHSLKATLNEYQLGIISTGAQYQMYSGLAVLIATTLFLVLPLTLRSLHIVNSSFAVGSLFFSGSLYLLATTGIKMFGFLTPIGGVLFIAGWCVLIGVLILSINAHKSMN